jgi:hypothetical protein
LVNRRWRLAGVDGLAPSLTQFLHDGHVSPALLRGQVRQTYELSFRDDVGVRKTAATRIRKERTENGEGDARPAFQKMVRGPDGLMTEHARDGSSFCAATVKGESPACRGFFRTGVGVAPTHCGAVATASVTGPVKRGLFGGSQRRCWAAVFLQRLLNERIVKLGSSNVQAGETMGIDIRVETESGEVQDEVLDDENLTEKLLPDREDGSSPCLRFVDPFGDALFNQIQLPFLIAELQKRLQHGSAKGSVRAHGEAILQAVKAAVGEAHTYVRFSGE